MIAICDFDDSFSYNLLSDLSSFSNTIVIPKNNIINFLKDALLKDDKIVIVLGPGPGNPDQYLEFINPIKNVLNKKNLFVFGVCLGHQLIWKSMGLNWSKSNNPVHGQSFNTKFKFFKKPLKIQRYNSLIVTGLDSQFQTLIDDGWSIEFLDNEFMLSSKDNTLTYQFHPESVGSSRKDLLYSPIKEFLLQSI
jgi:anthranilate/para-aminobenzoate synthase component II